MLPNILYVDDERFLRNTVERILKRAGYEFVGAENGADGVIKASEQKFDLIISDVRMPVMNGPQMVQQLRESGCTIPIVFMSGDTGEHEGLVQQMLFEELVQGFIHKPFDTVSLLDAIKELLVASDALNRE